MVTVTPRTATLLNIVTAQLPMGQLREIDTTGGKCRPLVIIPVAAKAFRVVQYTVLGEELLGDPAIEFCQAPTGEWAPRCLSRVIDSTQVNHNLDDRLPEPKVRRTLRFFIFFADHWLSGTVVAQQGGLLAIRRAVECTPSAYQH